MNASEIEYGFYRSYCHIAPGQGRIVLVRDFIEMTGTRVHVIGNLNEIKTNNINLLGPWLQVNCMKPILFEDATYGWAEAMSALLAGKCIRYASPKTHRYKHSLFYAPRRSDTVIPIGHSKTPKIHELFMNSNSYQQINLEINDLSEQFNIEEI